MVNLHFSETMTSVAEHKQPLQANSSPKSEVSENALGHVKTATTSQK